MDRSILHCDMNNFYASVERLFDPTLQGVPVAVCGDEELRHGIVLAKSEEAKKCGVKTGDAIWEAKQKCPEIRIVPPRFDRYVTYSRYAREIYLEYTDLVESFGLDECWLDVTASRLAFGDGVHIATQIRDRIRTELGLTISVGISFNKIFAKLGSDLKKPDAQTHIPRATFREQIWPLPVESILGVGPKAAYVLHRFGFHTLGKLALADDYFLRLQFGKMGAVLKGYARGEDLSPVLPCDFEPPMKSIGHGSTVAKDLETPEEVWTLILALSQEIGEKLRFHKKRAQGVALVCKDRNFFAKTLQKRLLLPTDCTMTLAREAFSLFRERYVFREPLRSVTVRAIDLMREEAQQLSLLTAREDVRAERIDAVTDSIRTRFGKNALTPARLLSSEPLPDLHGYVPFR